MEDEFQTNLGSSNYVARTSTMLKGHSTLVPCVAEKKNYGDSVQKFDGSTIGSMLREDYFSVDRDDETVKETENELLNSGDVDDNLFIFPSREAERD